MLKTRWQVVWKRATRVGRVARGLGRGILVVGLVAVVVLAFAGLLITRARPAPQTGQLADAASTPTVLLTPTSTPLPPPTPTATAIPTVVPSPTLPLPTPVPPQGPAFITQPTGGNIWGQVMNAQCQAPATVDLDFQVAFQVDLPPGGTVLYHWVHYDGATPGQPADVVFWGYNPTPDNPWTLPPTWTSGPVRIGAQDVWRLSSLDMTGSTARWGDQLVLDAVNGKPPATPLVSDIYHLATGC